MNEPRINFRKVKSDSRFDLWHVELFDESDLFPVGTAYVIADQTGFAQLNFILVADQWRNRGHGKRLVDAIKDRWPKLTATSAMGNAGESLLRRCDLMYEEEE